MEAGGPFDHSIAVALTLIDKCRKPADLAMLNSLIVGATQVEHDISNLYAEKDDHRNTIDFSPIHIAVLNLYEASDRERPSLEE